MIVMFGLLDELFVGGVGVNDVWFSVMVGQFVDDLYWLYVGVYFVGDFGYCFVSGYCLVLLLVDGVMCGCFGYCGGGCCCFCCLIGWSGFVL